MRRRASRGKLRRLKTAHRAITPVRASVAASGAGVSMIEGGGADGSGGPGGSGGSGVVVDGGPSGGTTKPGLSENGAGGPGSPGRRVEGPVGDDAGPGCWSGAGGVSACVGGGPSEMPSEIIVSFAARSRAGAGRRPAISSTSARASESSASVVTGAARRNDAGDAALGARRSAPPRLLSRAALPPVHKPKKYAAGASTEVSPKKVMSMTRREGRRMRIVIQIPGRPRERRARKWAHRFFANRRDHEKRGRQAIQSDRLTPESAGRSAYETSP